MAEVTRVPIQPIAKGSLTKLWLGVALAVALGGFAAWAAIPKAFSVETLVEGEGRMGEVGDLAFVKYTGRFASNGEEFDKWRPEDLPIPGIFPDGTAFPVAEGETVEGFFMALQQMKEGGTYEVYIPADMAYGATPPPGSDIPANADLIFEIEVVDFLTEDEVRQRIGVMQEAMQQLPPEAFGPTPVP